VISRLADIVYVDKRKVMHLRFNNENVKYVMDGKELEEVTVKRDLGTVIQNNLKCEKQCVKLLNTANRV
jgi:bifunctional pyridoxal-dependent enzyme with beta-cystathionase and maltose regulon repressor activities